MIPDPLDGLRLPGVPIEPRPAFADALWRRIAAVRPSLFPGWAAARLRARLWGSVAGRRGRGVARVPVRTAPPQGRFGGCHLRPGAAAGGSQ